MQTARAVLRERGYEQFLTLEVAQRCGVSEGTIYKYFKSKRDLLSQVAEEWFEEQLTEGPPQNHDEPIRERLFRVVWHNLQGIKREPALTRYVLLDLRADPQFRNTPAYQQNRRFAKVVMDVVKEGISRGELRDDVPLKLIRDIIFGAIEHQTWAFLRGEGDFSVDDSAAGIADVITRGIGLAEPKAPPTPPGEAGYAAAIERLEAVTRDLKAELAQLRRAKPAPKASK
ncbi:TetR/AcrR family transcriptional regulator [Oleomonas cavernae]|uniref:TetR/AcrR family transcriptional regulator n=2 Tax=Oleomonas cavernae TaxID=2320859 RepID=A0A418W8J6_9PROT|nr:TetR/AcrR family transcriptional regulator [Oleomonas cavernae]